MKGSLSEGFLSAEGKKKMVKLSYVFCTELKKKSKKPEAVWKIFIRHSGENLKKILQKK